MNLKTIIILLLLTLSGVTLSAQYDRHLVGDSILARHSGPILMSKDMFFIGQKVLTEYELESIISTSPYATQVLCRNARSRNWAPINIVMGMMGTTLGLVSLNTPFGESGAIVAVASMAIGINGFIQLQRWSSRYTQAARAYNSTLPDHLPAKDFGTSLDLRPTQYGIGLVYSF